MLQSNIGTNIASNFKLTAILVPILPSVNVHVFIVIYFLSEYDWHGIMHYLFPYFFSAIAVLCFHSVTGNENIVKWQCVVIADCSRCRHWLESGEQVWRRWRTGKDIQRESQNKISYYYEKRHIWKYVNRWILYMIVVYFVLSWAGGSSLCCYCYYFKALRGRTALRKYSIGFETGNNYNINKSGEVSPSPLLLGTRLYGSWAIASSL